MLLIWISWRSHFRKVIKKLKNEYPEYRNSEDKILSVSPDKIENRKKRASDKSAEEICRKLLFYAGWVDDSFSRKHPVSRVPTLPTTDRYFKLKLPEKISLERYLRGSYIRHLRP